MSHTAMFAISPNQLPRLIDITVMLIIAGAIIAVLWGVGPAPATTAPAEGDTNDETPTLASRLELWRAALPPDMRAMLETEIEVDEPTEDTVDPDGEDGPPTPPATAQGNQQDQPAAGASNPDSGDGTSAAATAQGNQQDELVVGAPSPEGKGESAVLGDALEKRRVRKVDFDELMRVSWPSGSWPRVGDMSGTH